MQWVPGAGAEGHGGTGEVGKDGGMEKWVAEEGGSRQVVAWVIHSLFYTHHCF